MDDEIDDDQTGWAEPDAELDGLARSVMLAATEVHRQLGAGLDEALYEAALTCEMRLRGIPFVRQPIIAVAYKGQEIGEKRLDFIVGHRLVVELKAVENIAPVHKAQVRTYLKLTRNQLGLLINFNVSLMKEGIRRVIYHE